MVSHASEQTKVSILPLVTLGLFSISIGGNTLKRGWVMGHTGSSHCNLMTSCVVHLPYVVEPPVALHILPLTLLNGSSLSIVVVISSSLS